MASSSQNRQPTANKGGSSSIATPANSGGSGLFGGSTVGATHKATEDSGSKLASSSGVQGNRRKSQEGSLFGNISNLKRDSSDQATQARKASLSEQTAKPGLIGQMWDNFTKGSTGSSK